MAALLAFFVLWAAIAAHPWASPARPAVDPRLRALAVREQRLRREAVLVKRVVAGRWARYESALRARTREIEAARRRHDRQLAAARAAAARIAAARQVSYVAPAAAPGSGAAPRVVTLPPKVQVVTLPPVTVSGSSHP